MWIGHRDVKEIRKLTLSSVSPSSERRRGIARSRNVSFRISYVSTLFCMAAGHVSEKALQLPQRLPSMLADQIIPFKLEL